MQIRQIILRHSAMQFLHFT